jgi:single-stranded-DNA-specific exonuclease
MKWQLLHSSIPADLEDLNRILLENRGLTKEADINEFFAPTSPLDISLAEVGIDEKHMRAALERIFRARDLKQDVVIFGDYDADGICSTAILWEALKKVGIIAQPFIPHREKHGYGISLRSLEALFAESEMRIHKKPDLIITVDNGIVAHEAFAHLRDVGVDAILTDHHQPESIGVPPALAVIHTTKVCGSGVAWFLARSLSREAAVASLDLTAIATIADQMPLLGINRSFVCYGLDALRETQRVGLQLLCAKANIDQHLITANSINFGIGPRINAMGRLKHGMDALRLICTKSMTRAESLVQELDQTNNNRQELTAAMLEDALTRASEWADERLIVVASPDYHEGVIGLIAGKLMETYSKPAIVISLGETVAKASARSINGVNIIELIRLVKDDLLEAGGHPMAAGFGLLSEKVPVVKKRLLLLAKERINITALEQNIDVECVLSPELISLETTDVILQFTPFGQRNREPVFGFRNMKVVNATRMGKEEKHLRLGVMLDATDASAHTQIFSAVGWGLGELESQLPPNATIHLAATIEINEWKGKQKIQLMVKDVEIGDR